MLKSNPQPAYVWGTFYTFWFLHCLYSLACVFGPLIFSGLNSTQKTYQENLASMIVCGIFIPPVVYLCLKFVPAVSSYRWLCFSAPLFLGLSVLFTVLMFRAADPEPMELYLKLGEEKTVENLSIRYESVKDEVYVLSLSTGDKSTSMELPVEEASAAPHTWEGHNIRVTSAIHDHSGIRLKVLKK